MNSIVNIPDATKLFPSQWLILCCVDFTSVNHFRKEEEQGEEEEEEGHSPGRSTLLLGGFCPAAVPLSLC